MQDLRVLISNDDGIYSTGIRVLYNELSRIYKDTWISAPDRNQSAASHALTLENPLRVQVLENDHFLAVRGTPTDSVYLAINELLKPRPNVVISGINHGANLGDDVIYSGTVAAATAGRSLGLPAIAISLCGSKHFETAAFFALKLLKNLEFCPIPSGQILNVNVPDLPLSEVKGVKVTRLGNRAEADSVIADKDVRGQPIYWVGPQGKAVDKSLDTDFYAIEHGYVSITPLQIDLTSYLVMDDLEKWSSIL